MLTQKEEVQETSQNKPMTFRDDLSPFKNIKIGAASHRER